MKFGIIGTNFVSDFFMEGAKLEDRCEVVAACGISQERLQTFVEKYNIPQSYTDYKEMAKVIDAVYIATPNAKHFEMAKYFLEKKIPVFCEKPLASNAKEVNELVRIAKENQVYFHEGLVSLYQPNYQVVKENLHLVGNLRQVNINFSKYSSRYDAYLRNENPTTFRLELSNGATMDLGVYCVAFAIGLFGKPNKILSTASLLENAADVAGSTIYDYGTHVVSLSYSKVCDANPVCEICGELGTIHVNHPSLVSSVTFTDRKTKEVKNIGVEQKYNFYYEVSEMIDQIENGKIESRSVPLQLSQDIHEVLTEMRRQSNIVFPADK
ncbi:MAG: Gfo/Idh/MocA family oxidoreductase [Erysipelotrichaceae bacterium]|nr:Gfo/Idh/MocA family oxidoreductase [Erysipelotrichaceae bacterium]